MLMGVNRAKWFLMTGERVSGEQLFEMGLVNFSNLVLPPSLVSGG